MNSILAAIPACCGVAFAWQGARRFFQSPNRYRLWVWLSGLCLLVGILVLLYTPILIQSFPHLFTPATHLVAHQVYNLSIMLTLYFTNLFLDDILFGPTSTIAKQHHRVLTFWFLTTVLLVAFFFVRALVRGESETASWLYAVPLANPDLMVAAVIAIIFMMVLFGRIGRFSLRFGRITPLRPFKTANLMFVVACGMTLGTNGLALIGILTPAASLLGHIIVSVVDGVTLIGMVIVVFAARLSDHPGKRLRAFGAGLWDIVSIIQLRPLWATLTTALPETGPADQPKVRPLGWWFIVRHIGAFRDQQIIEILDVIHRLEVPLWDEYTRSQYWRTNLMQFLNGRDAGTTPAQQMRQVEEHAMFDAVRIVGTLADYKPVDLPPQAMHNPSIYAVLNRPPAFSEYEIHYLELVSRAFARVRIQTYAQGKQPVVAPVQIPTLEDALL